MKKKIGFLLLGITVCISFAACAKNSPKDEETDDFDVSGQMESEILSDENSSEAEEEIAPDTQEQEEIEAVIYNMGDIAVIDDWEFTVTDMQIVESVLSGSIIFEPNDEGNKFAQAFITVTNNGQESDTFLPSFVYGDDVYAKLVYGDGNEYFGTQLIGYSADLFNDSLEPLEQQSGEMVFEIPEMVSDSTDELLLTFCAGNTEISFKVR